MSSVLSDISPLDLRTNVKRILWLDTYYFDNPYKNLSEKKNSVKYSEVKPDFVDMSLQFEFHRISKWQFKIICHRTKSDDSIPAGEYKLQFHCDISVFDEDIKGFEMKSDKFKAEGTFCLNESNRQKISEGDLEKMFDVKILITMIEFDTVLSKRLSREVNLFQEVNDKSYYKEWELSNLRSILNVSRLEDLYKGRHNLEYITRKRNYIKLTGKYSQMFANYLNFKNASITPTDIFLDNILKYVLIEKKANICDKDVIAVYFGAHAMGLNFLIMLSQDFLLSRLKGYENSSKIPEYENLMFEVLKASAHVNDESLFDKFARLLDNKYKNTIDYDKFLDRQEKSSIKSRFVICYLRRLKNLESGCSCFGRFGADATTRYVGSLQNVDS